MENRALSSYDPYDPWMTNLGVYAKRSFYRGQLKGKLLSVLIAVADWLTPTLSRKLMGATPKAYPITVAQWILAQPTIEDPVGALKQLMAVATPPTDSYSSAWGLGFQWMSKNGLYAETVPFVTHTPYAMEALLHLSEYKLVKEEALARFEESLAFLDSLLIMHEDEDSLALSYAPIEEPRIVVNANSYACFAYSLHLAHNSSVKADIVRDRALRLARWVVMQQHADGCWHYYADRQPGNFIDCFHSCFVLKNLLKSGAIIPEIAKLSAPAIEKGMAFLRSSFYDEKSGFVQRFTERDIKDPYVWDLYDQAEYLGVLVYLNQLEEAVAFRDHVQARFYKNGHWYCKTDIFGRLWGKDFYRWGIMPFLYNSALLNQKTKGAK